MLMTVVRDEKGEGHAVLTARTVQGDFILDNKSEEVKVWTQDALPVRHAPVLPQPEGLGRARHPAEPAATALSGLDRAANNPPPRGAHACGFRPAAKRFQFCDVAPGRAAEALTSSSVAAG